MKINEVMKRTGLSRKAIYIYEDRRLLSPLKNTIGYREYSEEDVERLLLIAKLRELDLSLDEIARLLQCPEEIDILMQKHLDRMERQLSDTMRKLSQIHTLLYNLPPNGQLEDLVCSASVAIPEDMAIAAAGGLAEDAPLSSARRLTMHMFEAFLDLPLDTPERWNAWYELLESMEKASAPLWDGYETYYGGMTAEQKYEDFRLRRALVVGYTRFTPQDERNKAWEILSLLERLSADPDYARRWSSYYRLVVEPSLYNPGYPAFTEQALFSQLSSVYHSYNNKFHEILDRFIYPHLHTREGEDLTGRLEAALGYPFNLSPSAMIYFDFFNNTLEKMITQPPCGPEASQASPDASK